MKYSSLILFALMIQSANAANPVWDKIDVIDTLRAEKTPLYLLKQNYLEAAPQGVGARDAWIKPGGRGENVKVIDVETSFQVKHEDFHQPFFAKQPAGNGGSNFDAPEYEGAFNLKLRDSGCILVGAGDQTSHERLSFSNYGSRIDAHGFGGGVTTTGYGDLFNGGANRLYTARFSGTSSATPIVAGAVAVVSSIAKAQGKLITPIQMRTALRATGTAQGATTRSQRIGNLPDIQAIAKFLGLH